MILQRLLSYGRGGGLETNPKAVTLAGILFITCLFCSIAHGSALVYDGAADAAGSKVIYAKEGTVSAQMCLDNAGPDGTCILPQGYSAVLKSSLMIRQPGQVLKCQPGAVLTKAANVDLVTVAASGVTITGCHLSDPQTSYDGNTVSALNVENLKLQKNTIEGSKGFGIFLRNVTHASITDNTLQGCEKDSIYGDGNTSDIAVSSNTIDASSTAVWHHAIGFHSHDASSRVSRLRIDANHIVNGYSFCVEVGAFGGLHPTSVDIANNVCVQKIGQGKPGGYSLDSVDGATVIGNSYTGDINGEPVLGIELVNGSSAKAANNALSGGGITINKQSFTIVDHNVVKIHSSADKQTAAIYSGSSQVVANNHNQITNNTLQISVSALHKPAFGIWLQCNADTIDCSDQLIIDNIIEGSSDNRNPAIRLENDHPTTAKMGGITIHGNNLKNWPVCYVQSASGIQSHITGNTEGCSSRFKK
jgi:nitrous oxidase accessory protein NosD